MKIFFPVFFQREWLFIKLIGRLFIGRTRTHPRVGIARQAARLLLTSAEEARTQSANQTLGYKSRRASSINISPKTRVFLVRALLNLNTSSRRNDPIRLTISELKAIWSRQLFLTFQTINNLKSELFIIKTIRIPSVSTWQIRDSRK